MLHEGRGTLVCGLSHLAPDHAQEHVRHSGRWCGVQGWCVGNVSVIGDAAHAGLPNGQGLNLALEDGMLMQIHPMHAALGANLHVQRHGEPRGCHLKRRAHDAGAVLGWHLRQHGVNAEALARFNAERGPRVKEVYTKVGLEALKYCHWVSHCCPNLGFNLMVPLVLHTFELLPYQEEGNVAAPDEPVLQGLDAHRGAEKERIIFETAFRSVQADRVDPPGDASSSSHERATLHVPARSVAARAHGASPQHAYALRRGGAALCQPRRLLHGRAMRPMTAYRCSFARLL